MGLECSVVMRLSNTTLCALLHVDSCINVMISYSTPDMVSASFNLSVQRDLTWSLGTITIKRQTQPGHVVMDSNRNRTGSPQAIQQATSTAAPCAYTNCYCAGQSCVSTMHAAAKKTELDHATANALQRH